MWVRSQRALCTSALFVCAALYAIAVSAETVRVAQVLDGDSLRLADGREIRLIGINAPERGKDGAPDQPLAREARAALARFIGPGEIRLDYDGERFDRYGRTLAHVSVPDGRSAEVMLLSDGLAFLIAQPPNLARLVEYREAEAEARRAGRGIWNLPYYKPRAAASLRSNETGFYIVEGRVERVGCGPHAIYLDLSERFTITIPHEHWHYFGGDAKRFLGQRVVVRGWVTAHENRLRLRLSHPVMLE